MLFPTAKVCYQRKKKRGWWHHVPACSAVGPRVQSIQQTSPKLGLVGFIWAGEQEIFLLPLLGWLICFFSSCKATSVQEKKVFLNAGGLLHHPMISVAGNLRKENRKCNKVSDKYAIARGARNFPWKNCSQRLNASVPLGGQCYA